MMILFEDPGLLMLPSLTRRLTVARAGVSAARSDCGDTISTRQAGVSSVVVWLVLAGRALGHGITAGGIVTGGSLCMEESRMELDFLLR